MQTVKETSKMRLIKKAYQSYVDNGGNPKYTLFELQLMLSGYSDFNNYLYSDRYRLKLTLKNKLDDVTYEGILANR